MKKDPYRDQANKSKQKLDPVKSENEDLNEEEQPLTRLDLQRLKREEKDAQKRPFPLIRVLLTSFVLLPLLFLGGYWFFSSNDGISLPAGNGNTSAQVNSSASEEPEEEPAAEEDVREEEDADNEGSAASEEENAAPAEEAVEEEPAEETPEEEPAAEETAEEPPAEEVTEEAPAEEEPANTVVHTVIASDTLYSIAVKYTGTSDTLDEIRALNGISGNDIFVGQQLTIPVQ